MAIRTVVRLNGQETDLADNTRVAINYQANDIGEVDIIKADYTQKIKLAPTEKNHKIMGNANKIGASEKIIYSKIDAEIEVSGLTILGKGSAIINGYGPQGYELNIFSGNYNFFDKIKGKSLRDLNLSSLNFTDANRLTHYQNNRNSTSGLCYPLIVTEPSGPLVAGSGVVNLETQIPWIYQHEIVSRIIEEAGFDYEGEVFSWPTYTQCVVSLKLPEGASPIFGTGTRYGDVSVDDLMHDITQLDFMKGFLARYGQFITTRHNKISFHHFDKIDKYAFAARDWTKKFNEGSESMSFSTGFGINNYLKYQNRDTEFDGPVPLAREEGVIVSNNKNLPENKTIGTIVGSGCTTSNSTASGGVGAYFLTEITMFEDNPLVATGSHSIRYCLTGVMVHSTISSWSYKEGVGTPLFTTPDLFTCWFAGDFSAGTNWNYAAWTHPVGRMDPQWILDNHYKVMGEYVIKDPMKVEAEFALTPYDIFELKKNPYIPVYVEGLGGTYYVNKIKDYIQGNLVKVELYKIFK